MSSYGPFADAGAFSRWFAGRLTLDDPYSYAIVDPGGRALGIATLMEIRPVMRVIEVGHIVYSPALQRRPLGTEAQYLLAGYAFETLGYRRYEWKCNALNAASRSAALRYGFVYEGTLRQHMIAKGRNRDTAWFSMLESEWPARRDSVRAMAFAGELRSGRAAADQLARTGRAHAHGSASVNCSSSVRWMIEKLSSEMSVSTVSPSALVHAHALHVVDLIAEIGLEQGRSIDQRARLDVAERDPPDANGKPPVQLNLRSSSRRSPPGSSAASLGS